MKELDRREEPWKEIVLQSGSYFYLIYWDLGGHEGLAAINLARGRSAPRWDEVNGYVLLPNAGEPRLNWSVYVSDPEFPGMDKLAWQDPETFIAVMTL